jgi:hydroxyacylglutathione hydrolase
MVISLLVGYFGTNCYIYSEDDGCLVIDPGGDADKIIRHLESSHLAPAGIVHTHGHLDHSMAAGALQAHFSNRHVPIAVHRNDAAYFGAGAEKESRKLLRALGLAGSLTSVLPLFGPIPEADVLLAEGDRLFGTDLEVVETAGHTPGGCCFYSPQSGVLFSGDTLFAGGIGRTDLPGGSTEALLSNIRTKLLTLPRETVVYPGHGPETTIGREDDGNPFLRI